MGVSRLLLAVKLTYMSLNIAIDTTLYDVQVWTLMLVISARRRKFIIRLSFASTFQ